MRVSESPFWLKFLLPEDDGSETNLETAIRGAEVFIRDFGWVGFMLEQQVELAGQYGGGKVKIANSHAEARRFLLAGSVSVGQGTRMVLIRAGGELLVSRSRFDLSRESAKLLSDGMQNAFARGNPPLVDLGTRVCFAASHVEAILPDEFVAKLEAEKKTSP
ncbi:MAG: hypothetical protein WCJ29_03780 [bacterium]